MLKSLELFGFKSFADRTLFEFSPGITCVVGPNGSGKSNVVDAIKWILGDQSAKSLRGKEMSDVIFNGAAGRRGSGFAEATLTFDNANGLLGIDAAQVQIGRRLYQSGDSEYLLNRASVRLKDIRDLFMGTGAGTAAYSIIEQGRVDQILQANPTTRRLVFEEAAGISKFKSRRVDAERRLERVAQNLLRLTDIVDQVESQLNSTRSQATKAARFRELSVELKAAWTGLAADDCRLLARNLDVQFNEIEELTAQLNEVQGHIQSLEAGRRQSDERLHWLENEVGRRERELAAEKTVIAAHEATIRHQTARCEEIQIELGRLRRQRFELVRQVDFARIELLGTSKRLAEFEEQFLRSQVELNQRESQLSELDQLAEERRQRISLQRRELAAAQAERRRWGERLVVIGSQAESLLQNQDQLQQRRETAQQLLAAARQERESQQNALDLAEAALKGHRDLLSNSQTARTRLIQQRDETTRSLRDLRERRSAAEARLTVLEELEQKQEGIAIGVREILKRSETSHYPPWNKVLGLVRDLIEVPMDLAPIIDAALGERAQLIAVSSLDSMIEYLNRGAPPIEGRVGFVSIAPFQPENSVSRVLKLRLNEYDLTGTPGVYGRADRLVKEREPAEGLATSVLGDTWIVETLDVACRVMESSPPHLRFVTLQGELIGADQQLFVGTMPHESSIISRKSELRQLKNEIQQLHRSIEAATERHAILTENLENRSGELTSLEAELQRLSNAVTECATRLSGQAQEVDRIERDCSELAAQLAQLAERSEQLAAERQQADEKIAALELAEQEVVAALDADQQHMEEVTALLQQTHQSMKSEQLELAKHEERLKSLRDTQSRLARDQQGRQQQVDEISRRLQETQRSRQKAEFEILAAEAGQALHALKLEAIAQGLRGFLAERDELRRNRSETARVEETHHKQRRLLVDRQHALEFEVQKQQHQLKTLSDRIYEEFQLSLEELANSGVSAYQQFLVEQYGSASSRAVIEEAGEPALETEESAGTSALVPSFEEVRPELEARVDRLRRKIKMMGNVNTDALESLEELENRYQSLSTQLKDLQEAKGSLEEIIRRINHESKRIFIETFETIRGHFQELFRKLFGGGDADIILENPDDVLECGIDIVARPPGKELRSMSLLSGGEKTMTAVGLLFAMFRSKPSPYCILDEVDAALDEANVDRYVTVLKEFVSMTQFIVITHRKRTMTAADVLYGVTMEQAGVSKRIAVKFDDVRDNGEIRTAA
ncbi:chromosome segregation protein SMC [Planctomicrobium sp. SH664]|uniref:chromosome segregation protein SMC n=1 Tax=Planctomicrobium sp. SH664 TaxID=3448125 RepID=UPI003F5C9AD0